MGWTPTRVGQTRDALWRRVIGEVDPHSRGANLLDLAFDHDALGGPPLAWGKLRSMPHTTRRSRWTPTRVGQTQGLRRPLGGFSVDPHSRGANGWESAGIPDYLWSGWTPTRVGQTLVPDPSDYLDMVWRVDPHSRGANGPFYLHKGRYGGGPPLAWGKRSEVLEKRVHQRWTPTRVGQTGPSIASTHASSVDPHSRGANPTGQEHYRAQRGGPPLAWGKPRAFAVPWGDFRWTPTRVGQTPGPVVWESWQRVDPHSRGANTSTLRTTSTLEGGPPLAWGKRIAGVPDSACAGWTPTRVGQTATGIW